ncbi:MAG: threonine ammonia-lyase IlvA [Candidatus Pacebacteria bacterium]|nr:threonine ammonia-lyase IlvA [Candidatus Paceibacterota bacterium]
MNKIKAEDIEKAKEKIEGVVKRTPLEYSQRLSKKYGARIYLKREDLQPVRSYKIRGAYNFLSSLNKEERNKGVVCASAGNHAQGVAYSCKALKIKGVIFMPETTPKQKVNKVIAFGGSWTKIKLVGKTFDESNKSALVYNKEKKAIYIHPFDDYRTMAGQGTIAVEVLEEMSDGVDIVIAPIGGGGLVSGIGTYLKEKSPKTKILGVEPSGAASMHEAIKKGKVVELDSIDSFVDGTAVKKVGFKTFKIARKILDNIAVVPEGKVCATMIELYQNEGIVAEPAGALSITALDDYQEVIKGKTVVCILSGGNNDLSRYPEIIEKSLVYQGLRHYLIIEFFQKPGELKTFVTNVLGAGDDITRFEYIKRTNKQKGPALVGIELSKKEDLKPLLKRMDEYEIHYKYITPEDGLLNILI